MPCTDEAAIILAISNLEEKKRYIAAAIVSLQRNLRHLRFLSQDISAEEFERMRSLPLSSGQHPMNACRKLPVRPSTEPTIAQ